MLVIVNADDFGYSHEATEATIECIEAGAVSSVTVMPNMPATDVALAYLTERRPPVSVGVHLTLVGDGPERPLTDGLGRRLVRADGTLRSTTAVRLAALLGLLPAEDLARELAAQITRVKASAVDVSHVDSHRHIHKFASVARALRPVLSEAGIHRVRGVQDVYLTPRRTSPTYWAGRRWARRFGSRLTTTDHFYMPASAGDRSWVDLLDRPITGVLEIGVHPGREDEWRARELEGTLEFLAHARRRRVELVTWNDV
jgi:predicted glycoside hydrolase/deacetylase ChbG (UPF0249 family)